MIYSNVHEKWFRTEEKLKEDEISLEEEIESSNKERDNNERKTKP